MELLVFVLLASIKYLLYTVFIMIKVRFNIRYFQMNIVSLAIPCVLALLPGRSGSVYQHIFHLLENEAEKLGLKFDPDVITSDFEPGLIKAINRQVGAVYTQNYIRLTLVFFSIHRLTSFQLHVISGVIFIIHKQFTRKSVLLASLMRINMMKKFDLFLDS